MRRNAGNTINIFQNISYLPGQSSLLFCIGLIEYSIKAAIPYSLPSTGFTCKQLCQKFRCQLRILRNSKQLCGKLRPETDLPERMPQRRKPCYGQNRIALR